MKLRKFLQERLLYSRHSGTYFGKSAGTNYMSLNLRILESFGVLNFAKNECFQMRFLRILRLLWKLPLVIMLS